MEDLSFSYLDNETYTRLAKKVSMRRKVREDIVNTKINQMEEVLKKHNISAVIEGRPKHFYSIYKKNAGSTEAV